MSRNFLIVSALALSLIIPSVALASDRDDDVARTHKAADVFRDIMNTPDKGIPGACWHRQNALRLFPAK